MSSATAVSSVATERRRWAALYVAAGVAAIVLLDISKVNVALPSIAAALDAGPTALQLISTGYVLAFGLVLIPFGRLGDQGHRRALVLGGLALYVAAGLVGALAWTTWVVVLGRVLLGVAAGMLMPQAIGLIQQLFSGPERGRAFGAYGVTTATATALGPSLGGLLVTLSGPEDGWRWIFLMNVPIGLALLGAAAYALPRSQPVNHGTRGFDPVGTVLVGLAVAFLLYPVLLTTGRPDDDPDRWWSLLLAAGFTVAFARWERGYAARGGSPLIDPALVRTPSYRAALVVAMAWLACGPGMMLALVLFLQLGLGFSPFLAALVWLPAAVGSGAGAWWAARRILTRGRRITLAGLGFSAVAMVATVLVTSTLAGTAAAVAIACVALVQGLGGGFVLSPNHVLLLADVPSEKGSLAASLGHLAQRIGNSVGLAAGAAAFFAVVNAAAGAGSGAVSGAVSGAGSGAAGAGPAEASLGTYRVALATAYAVCAVFLLLAVLVVLADHRRRLRDDAARAGQVRTERTVIVRDPQLASSSALGAAAPPGTERRQP